MQRPSNDYNVHVHVNAEYQLFSDETGWPWMNGVLSDAINGGLIEDYKVLDVQHGPFGLQFIVFSVDMFIPERTMKAARKHVRKQLNRIVGDTDVNVRWLSRIE